MADRWQALTPTIGGKAGTTTAERIKWKTEGAGVAAGRRKGQGLEVVRAGGRNQCFLARQQQRRVRSGRFQNMRLGKHPSPTAPGARGRPFKQRQGGRARARGASGRQRDETTTPTDASTLHPRGFPPPTTGCKSKEATALRRRGSRLVTEDGGLESQSPSPRHAPPPCREKHHDTPARRARRRPHGVEQKEQGPRRLATRHGDAAH